MNQLLQLFLVKAAADTRRNEIIGGLLGAPVGAVAGGAGGMAAGIGYGFHKAKDVGMHLAENAIPAARNPEMWVMPARAGEYVHPTELPGQLLRKLLVPAVMAAEYANKTTPVGAALGLLGGAAGGALLARHLSKPDPSKIQQLMDYLRNR